MTPHYRLASPLANVIGKVAPGQDAFPTEKYAEEIEAILNEWSLAFVQSPPDFRIVSKFLAPELTAHAVSQETRLRSHPNLEGFARLFSGERTLSHEHFMQEFVSDLGRFSRLTTAEFKITSIRVSLASPLRLETRIRYDLVGSAPGVFREELVGYWDLEWERNSAAGSFYIRKWRGLEETRTRASGPMFVDISSRVLGGNSSYAAQMLPGTDHWRTLLDAACGIDVYGNNGVAAGDIDNDGFDDLYVCQPAGLPNRLYRNRGDGTFEDVTEGAGVGVLDSTACALFADLDNDGYQDLIVVRSTGPLLFLNQKNGKFRLKRDAFRFAQPPLGTFTGAALADFDRDGRLDVYFCLYLYYQGLDQYRFPVPYHDARNGPPNFLFHNEGDATFLDVTASAGMNQNNNRFSFACGWSDDNNDGWPDLYVANDFGRKNLYRNKGDGTFADIAGEAGVEDVGAGMSVCWFDYDGDGSQDLYVADMWSAAGKRLTMQENFIKGEKVRALYQKHASGNSLFHNRGDGRYEDTSHLANVAFGRWAWSSDAWDFDHDGYPDLYITNGMISGPNTRDLGSFFWRQVVSHSPADASPSQEYEQGWNAINELIRSDGSWSGYERNVFYVNQGDGRFADASGTAGLDFPDDSRAFAFSDFDHDGRLEIVLKNRTAPQLRVLRNEMPVLSDSIAIRLRGTKSNRDAIGAQVTIEAGGRRQSRFLQAGSGFLSQHTKDLFFGLGEAVGSVRATVRWPSGAVQVFGDLPRNHRVEIEEGAERFQAHPFVKRSAAIPGPPPRPPSLPSTPETWLIEPLAAPQFALQDLAGNTHALSSLLGTNLLLNFWATWSPSCQKQMQLFEEKQSAWAARGLRVVAVNVNDPPDFSTVKTFLRANSFSFLILLSNEDMSGIYNVLYRYLFDRRRDLGIPTSFLIDSQGSIIKVFQGPLDSKHLEEDLGALPHTAAERLRKALPFPGDYYGGEFLRNYFTYGAAYFQRGYFDQAAATFELVVRANPDYAEAHYNLGTLYLKKKKPDEARQHLLRAVELRPDYPDALNNLGMLAAEAGRSEKAVEYFEQAIRQRPSYTIAYENLGNLYRHLGRLGEAQARLEQALLSAPEDPEVNYSLGMLFAQKGDTGQARQFLEKAVRLRPNYPEALNNLGVLFLRTGKTAEAARTLENCIRVAPSFDQAYLNLANLYVAGGDRERAREILGKLLEQDPNHKLARKALEQLTP